LSAPQEAQLDHVLRGEASKVYWLLLKNTRPVDAYEIQRQMHFRSPIPLVQRHLDELTNIGLAEKQESGNYVAASEVRSNVLRHYLNLGRLLFPRYLFYASFATLFYSAFLLFFVERFSRENLFISFFGAIVCVIFWYEAKRFWSLRPY
jgi:hypothetical protein